MTKRVNRQSKEQNLMHRWWARAVLALVFASLAYGFASWAIDSGAWLAYGLTIFFAGWSLVQLKKSARYLLSR